MGTAKLKKAVRAAGLRQKDLAEALNITEAAVSRILNGRRGITVDTAFRIVEILRHRAPKRRGLTVDSLFGKAA